MKKIALYSILAVAGLALCACNEDYKDWAEPQSPVDPGAVNISFTPSAVGALDLRGMDADSVVAFTPNLVVTGTTDVNTKYDVTIHNANNTDSVTIKGDEQGRVRRSDLQGAIIALFGNIEQARQTTMNITANMLISGLMTSAYAYNVGLTATPEQQELPPVWYVLANCIGTGGMLNNAIEGGPFGAMYTSLVAMYPNPLNYEELVLPAYLCANAKFKVILKPGSKEDFIGGAVYDDNIEVADAGYYKIIANTKDKTLRYERMSVADVKVYSSMGLSNGTSLAKVTTNAKGENHDWHGNLVVADGGQSIKFVADDGTTWGSEEFPAGKAMLDGAGIPCEDGTYKVVFNDLMGLFRFIKK